MAMQMSDVVRVDGFVCQKCDVQIDLYAIIVDNLAVEVRMKCSKCGDTIAVIFDGFKSVRGKGKGSNDAKK